MEQIKIVAKARGIVVINGTAYAPNQYIPSVIDKNVYEAIKDNIIVEKVEDGKSAPKDFVENGSNNIKKEKAVAKDKVVKETDKKEKNDLDDLFE